MQVQKFMKAVLTADYALFAVGGLGLGVMMLVTLTDVVMRYMGKPIFGSMEIVCFTSAVVIGFAIPYTSWTKGHIIVDFLMEKLSPGTVRILADHYEVHGHRALPVCGIQFRLLRIGSDQEQGSVPRV